MGISGEIGAIHPEAIGARADIEDKLALTQPA
jgi:hypothetical protein